MKNHMNQRFLMLFQWKFDNRFIGQFQQMTGAERIDSGVTNHRRHAMFSKESLTSIL